MKKLSNLFILGILILLFCSKQNKEVSNLAYCDSTNCEMAKQRQFYSDSGIIKPVSIHSCPPLSVALKEPCLSDSNRDTINFGISTPIRLFVNFVLLNNDENIIKEIINDTIVPGNYSYQWPNPKNGEIYGISLLTKTYNKTLWFYAK
jgi:hypothetical protein